MACINSDYSIFFTSKYIALYASSIISWMYFYLIKRTGASGDGYTTLNILKPLLFT